MHSEDVARRHGETASAIAIGSPVKILLIGEQPVFQEGLKTLFEREIGFTVVGVVGERDETVKAIRDFEPDVLLVSLTGRLLAAMLQTLHVLTLSGNRARTILLAPAAPRAQIAAWQQLGVAGILLKETSAQAIFDGVRSVAAGGSWLGQPRREDVRHADAGRGRSGTRTSGLTPREIEIVEAVRRGATNRHIATELGITLDTVKHHIANIFSKVGVVTRLQLAVFAMNGARPGEPIVEEGNAS
jgi:two-component system, NarL family, nitrate/nitrite response regulator NarL